MQAHPARMGTTGHNKDIALVRFLKAVHKSTVILASADQHNLPNSVVHVIRMGDRLQVAPVIIVGNDH